ncbi:hypothetical protein [Mesorhizobium sp.]|uniref:hypothetical protein n=1 Tax=Mesorhizobium sp. TaxID=1871066 RepID=UPI000FE3F240|nr:hypothetical protein [Mesorhizobium sp.]RWI35521.1 MAG: hypothetical protein EOR14_28885 [Mesorhizobium sp.]RWJ03457.1 MAG: hypothetical protein EOR24_32265 [Mesorhizobium sp.]RWJ66310.1 MAG: hypothetical protein EOR34_28250 [Mesorhizobium sp.]
MNIAAFNILTENINHVMQNAVKEYFEELGIKFDVNAYLAQASTDHHQTAIEMLFHGANIWPITDEPVLCLAA